VVAADFAAIGWTAAEQILEAQRGFFHAYGGTYDPSAIVDRLGNPWTLQNPGVSIKPFPSGSLTHPGMTELLRLIRANSIKAADVERVDVGTNHNMPNALIHHRPQNEAANQLVKKASEGIASLALTLIVFVVVGRMGVMEQEMGFAGYGDL